jgi:hypothetical protein
VRDDRFTVKIVGNDETVQWQYDGVTEKDNPPGGTPFPRDRQISVSPRFDDFYVRENNETVDRNLEYLYLQQWQRALDYAKKGTIDFVTITSWNEYPERTAIEPHYDATANNKDPYLLYNETKQHITELRTSLTPASLEIPPETIVIILVLILVVSLSTILILKRPFQYFPRRTKG